MFIHGKQSYFHKLVFELRYRQGYTYLDRCGKIINAITRESPEWSLKSDQVSPQGAALISIANQCTFSFSSQAMSFSIEQSAASEITRAEVDRFIDQVDLLATIVIDQLGLKEFARIGLRTWYFFPSSTKEESERWLSTLGLFSVSDSIQQAFGGQVEAIGISIVLTGSDRRYRVALNGVEKSAMLDLGSELLALRASSLPKERLQILKGQSRRLYSPSGFGGMIDIDCFQEEPISIEPRDFVTTSIAQGLSRVAAAIVPPRN